MKVLLVRDVAVGSVVRHVFESEGIDVDEAVFGDEPDVAISGSGYDLVIIELSFPGPEGVDICRRMRRVGDWTPVLVVTAAGSDEYEAQALEWGVDDYVTKPVSTPVLLARARALFRRSGARRLPAIRAGDLRIDPGNRRAWRGDDEIELTMRQFDVLEFLFRRSGRVVSKEEILAGVWERTFVGDPNIVEVYIGRIRSRVDRPYGRHTIETVRGVGYRLASNGG